MANHVVCGAGLVGGVVARELARRGDRVVVFERRGHIGGNLFDYVDDYGIRVQRYGPHIFHTDLDEVNGYLAAFAEVEPFVLKCGSVMDGVCVPTAFDFTSVDAFFPAEADEIKAAVGRVFAGRSSATILELLDCGDEQIERYARFLYDKDFKPYTAKQWGIDPDALDRQVFKRVPILFSYGSRYFEDRHQWMPAGGFTGLMGRVLGHPNIDIELNVDALDRLDVDSGAVLVDGRPVDGWVVYTGPIDELFGCRFGALPYRSLTFDVRHEDVESFQDMPVVAYPQEEGFTRITEYNKLPVQEGRGSTYAVEYPIQYRPGESEPYYPVLTEDSRALFGRYAQLAAGVRGLACCGRLADFKYYNMDQAVKRALEVAARLLGEEEMR